MQHEEIVKFTAILQDWSVKFHKIRKGLEIDVVDETI